ncbi:uncharacterized protein N7482_006023 [Penicillium canariense]|uniref:Major facilitator superfamily (MFS) profile domain-containing protein n=1 Tax=Penicillium canariense TaxID=189055 RepID=A0A9W9I7K3_9EURO|nr:uncharacterized protein N7482_006023 [Penicillium canariense]KAJ5167242.1 hypothetical protein N7482_006023 [Penicillium canariense]
MEPKDIKVEQPPAVEKDVALGDVDDIGAGLFIEADRLSADELERESAKVLRILDWRLMPILYVTYVIQFLDKLSLNYASAYSLIPDLGLEGQRYSWVAAIFNFGYLFWAIPANLLLQKLPVAKYMGGMLIIWSIIVIAHIGAKNYAGILVLRFLLGMAEAGVSPCMMMITSMFYKRSEQPLRMAIWLSANGMATMVGALLGFGLGHSHNTTLHSWQLIFLTIGLLNFRVAENMIGVKNRQIKLGQAVENLYDIKVLCCVGIGIGCGVINGGGIYATLLQLPTGAFEAAIVPICGLVATYVPNSRCVVLATVCLIPFAGLLGIRFTSLDHRWTLVGCTWLQYIVGAPVIVCWNILSTNVAGHTKRAVANGLWFTLYAAGNVAGANIFFSREAPRYYSALTGLLVCYAGIIVLSLVTYVVMRWENIRRDAAAMVAGENVTASEAQDITASQAILDGFKDITDMEAKHFRYAL